MTRKDEEDLTEVQIILQTFSSSHPEIIALSEQLKACITEYIQKQIIIANDSSPENSISQKTLDQAIIDLSDPLIPIQASGINTIRKLVLSHDPVILSKLTFIIMKLLELIQNPDSYIEYFLC